MASDESKYPPPVISTREGPELGRTARPQVISKSQPSEYPLIDCDPHFSRVVRYARPTDWLAGGALAAFIPAGLLLFERTDPSLLPRKSIVSIVRLGSFAGLAAGFLLVASRSSARFYGFRENRREIEMDMKEMTDRVKKGLPLYGKSTMTEYMQGVAHRNSRYTGVFLGVVPWFNFVNHPYHGVDTAKYYRQAELELEAERGGKLFK